MTKLYPLKFTPKLDCRVWGGNKLLTKFGKTVPEQKEGEPAFDSQHVAESWELYDMEELSSPVCCGSLEGNTIGELIETYLGDIVGDNVYDYFGNQFPLLIKYLDVTERLSVQVHPNDKVALERYNSFGKTEFWYVMEAEEDACVYMGFKRDVTVEEFYQGCQNETVDQLMNVFHPKKGDCFMINAGTVHAASGGIVIAEVQQQSDMTFRLYDWGREHNPATARKTHLAEAIDVIDYKKYDEANHIVDARGNRQLADCKYFTINNVQLDTEREVSNDFGSFVLYMCTGGEAQVRYAGESYSLKCGETILIPAALESYVLAPVAVGTTLVETYIRPIEEEKDDYIEGDEPIVEMPE